MKRRFCLTAVLLFFTFAQTALLPAYFVTYKEQYYKLYHIHYQQYPDDTLENIYWLEKAINADFCNPLYALGKIPLPIYDALKSQNGGTASPARYEIR